MFPTPELSPRFLGFSALGCPLGQAGGELVCEREQLPANIDFFTKKNRKKRQNKKSIELLLIII